MKRIEKFNIFGTEFTVQYVTELTNKNGEYIFGDCNGMIK